MPRRSGNLFLQFGEEVKSVERLKLVEIGIAELVEYSAIKGGEEDFLVAVSAVR